MVVEWVVLLWSIESLLFWSKLEAHFLSVKTVVVVESAVTEIFIVAVQLICIFIKLLALTEYRFIDFFQIDDKYGHFIAPAFVKPSLSAEAIITS